MSQKPISQEGAAASPVLILWRLRGRIVFTIKDVGRESGFEADWLGGLDLPQMPPHGQAGAQQAEEGADAQEGAGAF